ncbi:MAG TPA: glycoside hydrolase family 28 protein [Chthonomonas sp.]|uniref:glycoside hydrolase family 28 protein n=1 Tax=Chthonomonas sp. TaxID=2282153 RepID=UPI002B4B949E|nr:glycoside hydrolase family 28 protein [Chthonomonas sp.]HLI47313.1 glycoside hydrolase family 28 protein [Chthonomonas sp.]
MNRRELLGFSGAFFLSGGGQSGSAAKELWWDVRRFGAVGDGKTKNTAALQQAIEAAFRAGGGTVYVPAGTYLTGGLVLKSNVRLYLEAGATLLGSTDPADYEDHPGPAPGGDANTRHLLFAENAENIALCGLGTVDGQGPAFWQPTHRPPPRPEDLWRDVIAYDYRPIRQNGKQIRPSPMLEFVRCRNVHIEGVLLANSPGWTLRPILCETVTIRGIRVRNPVYGPNTDGMDITCCHNVFISDCDIATGDDAICLKSENPYGGPVQANENITITNCVLTTCCNGFKMGTATHGAFRDITFANSVIYNADADPINARVISGIAVEMVDGGSVEGVVISNIAMRNVRTPLFVRLGTRTENPAAPTSLRGVRIGHIYATGSLLTSSITGLPEHRVQDVQLENICIETVEGGKAEWVEHTVPEQPKAYPEARMFGRLPAYGLYCRHVDGLRLSQLELVSKTPDGRPALVCDDVKDLDVNVLHASSPSTEMPVVQLNDVQDAFLHGCAAPQGVQAFLMVSGARTARVRLVGNDLSEAKQAFIVKPNVPKGAVREAGNLK